MPVRDERHIAVQARRDDEATHADMPVYPMSVAAELTGLHPQTLRGYDRADLVRPRRSEGGNRLYSRRDIERLRKVHELSGRGINHDGIGRILALESEVDALAGQLRRALRQVYAAQAELVRANAAQGSVVVRRRGEVEKWRPPG